MADEIEKKQLQEFLDELERIRFEIRKSVVLSKGTDKYVRNLEKLISTSKDILKGNGKSGDSKKFEKLVRDTDFALKTAQKKNRKDEAFQNEFTKVFGEIKESQDFSNSVLSKLSTNLGNLARTVQSLNTETTRDVAGTGSDFFAGPFGKIAFNIAKDVKEVGGGALSRLKGQAHDGIDRIPSEGTYMLDGGERVVSRKQNEDLTNFLSGNSNNPVQVFNQDHDSSYFDSIIDNDDRIATEEQAISKHQHREVKGKFEILGDIINKSNLSFLTNMFIQFELFRKRFWRHPVANSLALALKPLTATLNGIWRFFFGKKAKKDTDRIVQSNEDIVHAINGTQRDNRVFTRKIFDATIGRGVKALFGVAKTSTSKFFRKDKMDVLIEKTKELVSISAKHLGISGETLEQLEMGLKKGVMGVGDFFKKHGPMLAKSIGKGLLLVGALFGGFELGTILNKKLGEWLDLDMGIGEFIGDAVADFFDSFVGGIKVIGMALKQDFFGTISSIASGKGVPRIVEKHEMFRNVKERFDAGQITVKERDRLIRQIDESGKYDIVPVDKTKIRQQQVAQRTSNASSIATPSGNVVNNNVVNNNKNEVRPKAAIDDIGTYLLGAMGG